MMLAAMVAPRLLPCALAAETFGPGTAPASAPPGDSDSFLREAREALSKGNFPLAEWYVGQAEKAGPRRTGFALNPFADSAEKVKAEIAAAKQKTAADDLNPSSRLAPIGTPGGLSARTPSAAGVRPDPFLMGDPNRALEQLTDNSKAKADLYLKQGREALARNDSMMAVGYYQKAVATGASFGPNEYSPKQFADDLEKFGVQLSQIKTPAVNSFGPTPPRGLETSRDPAPLAAPAAAPTTADRAFSKQVVDNPFAVRPDNGVPHARPTNLTLGGTTPTSTPNTAPNAAPANLQTGQEMLRDARKELARRNIKRAGELANQAKTLGITYPLHADSPDRVLDLLQRLQAMQTMPNDANLTKAQGSFLLMQAEGLLYHREWEPAEHLAQQAKAMGVVNGPYSRGPDAILQQAALLKANANGPNSAAVPAAINPGANPAAPQPGNGDSSRWEGARRETQRLLAEAQIAFDRGDYDLSSKLTDDAKRLGVPDASYRPGDVRPFELELKLSSAKSKARPGGVALAGGGQPEGPVGSAFSRGVFDPSKDTTRLQPASDAQPTPSLLTRPDDAQPTAEATPGAPVDPQANPTPAGPPAGGGEGQRLYEAGLAALQKFDNETARQCFLQAWQYQAQLDPLTRQQLKDKLQQVRPAPAPRIGPNAGPEPTALDLEAQKQIALSRALLAEITREQEAATKQAQKDPRGALGRLEQLRQRVAQSELGNENRKSLQIRVEKAIESLQAYIETNRAKIDETENNERVLSDVERKRRLDVETNQQLARMVDQFNTLLNQQRFPEAMILAKQAQELDGQNPVVQNMVWKAQFAQRFSFNASLQERKQSNYLKTMDSTEESAIPFDDRNPIEFPDTREWTEMRDRRGRLNQDRRHRHTESELAIKKALQTQVDVNFTNKPLGVVIHTLAQVAGINVFLDPQGLQAEGVNTDTPVTINLNQPIKLESALNLILHKLRLSYVIQDEVLQITSEQTRDADVYSHVYGVADLVIPIPNFVPSYNIGLPGAIKAAHESLGLGLVGGRVYNEPLAMMAGNSSPNGTNGNASVLAQMAGSGMKGTGGNRGSMPVGYGPGGLGGGPVADFDTLIDLITSTIAPTTWDTVGGPGSVAGFDTNLSLVVSQTQEIHEEIVDLLEQLRRLQDLQVTIEVRFITLSDSFFERIGVDFDFNIDTNVTLAQATAAAGPGGSSVTIGNSANGLNATDLVFNQGSFGAVVPSFGGFNPASAATFGFAILSDIEAFFVITAAQGDTRSNIMQAPKVTLFNGQQAFVSDTTQRPFVTSVIPVVGDFAAAHQPVVVVLNEGTSLSVQAVVSNDRRFVRLTLVPFFSKIGDVQEFTFNGKTTTTTGTAAVDPADPKKAVTNEAVTTREGTTIQLPVFSFTTVTTTVSVPDGGTVLLGGIKRLSEQRIEQGVPVLSKVPYINRLFRNVAIARQASSLMMMVTPRIIIQEEEEEKLGIAGFRSTSRGGGMRE